MTSRDIGASALRIAAIVGVLVLVVVATAYATMQIDGSPDSGPDEEGVTRINSCTEIGTAGAYELTRNVENSNARACIRITASNVTFEGNDYRIDGVSTFDSGGIVVGAPDTGTRNVTVANATVTDWGEGVRYHNVTGGTVEDVRTANNRIGVAIRNGSRNVVTNVTATANGMYGISIAEASRGNTLSNNTARANALFGVHLVGTDGNVIEDTRALDNQYGIALLDADRNTLRANNASFNEIAGVWLSAAGGNEIRDNTVSNRFYGIYLGDRAARNLVANNTAVRNAVGIRLIHSPRNVIVGNTLRNNGAEGILLISSNHNRLAGNALASNGRGVVVSDSANVTRGEG